ncbi:MAG: flavodoxin domain-containing protein [Chloroflexaceae bacterium]
MSQRVLVAYATKYGATAEIAERIGQSLRQAGLEVDVAEIKPALDLTPYAAVVVGSAVYAGAWRREAIEFLQGQSETLSKRPLWIFSSGPTGEGDPVTLLKGWRVPEGQRHLVERLQPRDVTVFHGNIDTEKLNLAEKLMISVIKAPTGDFRNWEAIEAWAGGIAAALQESGALQSAR